MYLSTSTSTVLDPNPDINIFLLILPLVFSDKSIYLMLKWYFYNIFTWLGLMLLNLVNYCCNITHVQVLGDRVIHQTT